MKNKILLILIAILLVGVMFSSRSNTATFYNELETIEEEKKDETKISLYNPNTEEINNLELEEYVIGVIAAEMPASFKEEALKAQAVAARTYALYKMLHSNKEYDVISSISNQAFNTKEEMKDKWQDKYEYYYNKINKAVSDTKGEVMMYNNEPIIAYYFAISNGKTEDSEKVFGNALPYIASVESLWDTSVNKYQVTNNFSKSDFCKKLDIVCDSIIIKDIKNDESGRVESITINNKVFKGTDVRKLLGLRSTDFKIDVSNEIVITTKGYGHGCGMSQYGANAMATLGYSYDEILKHYYQNIEIKNLNV